MTRRFALCRGEDGRRCRRREYPLLLKLAGTRYFRIFGTKILLLEAYGGEVPQMATYLAQLKQLGAFEKVGEFYSGTFTAMEAHACSPDIPALVKEAAGTEDYDCKDTGNRSREMTRKQSGSEKDILLRRRSMSKRYYRC